MQRKVQRTKVVEFSPIPCIPPLHENPEATYYHVQGMNIVGSRTAMSSAVSTEVPIYTPTVLKTGTAPM